MKNNVSKLARKKLNQLPIKSHLQQQTESTLISDSALVLFADIARFTFRYRFYLKKRVNDFRTMMPPLNRTLPHLRLTTYKMSVLEMSLNVGSIENWMPHF